MQVGAHAQTSSAADAQKVVEKISQDRGKTEAYCELAKVAPLVDEAKAKNDTKTVNELNPKIVRLVTKLGPEYEALMKGFTPEISSVLMQGAKKTCAK